MTNDRPIHRLNSQWQASIHFNRPMVGQYDVITMKRFINDLNRLKPIPIDVFIFLFIFSWL